MRTIDATAADCINRIGHGATTTVPWADRRPTVADIRVYNDVLPSPEAYRAAALALSYRSVTVGLATFHGLAEMADDALLRWISARHPSARPTLTFFRQSPYGQVEPNFIHTDRDMGDWTAILYLNPDPADGDGTTFWEQIQTGDRASQATTDAMFLKEGQDWREASLWRPWHTVHAKCNRLVLFPAPLFHSRSLLDNYGTAGQDARLTQLVFGTGADLWEHS